MNTIFLIEDDLDHIELISRIIEASDIQYEFYVSMNLYEARKYLNENIPALLISDLKLPDGNAIEFLKEIIPLKKYPVLALTSHGNEKMAVDIMKAGAQDYLVKSENLFWQLPIIIKNTIQIWDFQKQKEIDAEKLRLSEMTFRNIFENIVDTYYETSLDGIILEISPSIKVLTNGQYNRYELIGKSILDFYSEIHLREKMIEELLRKKHLTDYEITLVNRDGSIVPCSITSKIVFSENGIPIKIIGTLRNITERKTHELELMKVYDGLELLVQKRTEELATANLELKKVIDVEKELNAMKSAFISVISHEFRTPLAGILSSVDLLKRFGDKWDLEKKDNLYRSIRGAINYTNLLLDDVAILGKDESGKLKFNPTVLNLKDFCEQLVDDLFLSMEGFNRVKMSNNSTVKTVLLDLYLIRHILYNILNNALKYSSAELPVEFVIFDIDNTHLCFEVIDKGIGIPEKDLPHIFAKFQRGGNVEGLKGTGIGLPIVKRCIELHGGAINVDSKINFGTIVRIVIPIN